MSDQPSPRRRFEFRLRTRSAMAPSKCFTQHCRTATSWISPVSERITQRLSAGQSRLVELDKAAQTEWRAVLAHRWSDCPKRPEKFLDRDGIRD
jgi:hypothetical protein